MKRLTLRLFGFALVVALVLAMTLEDLPGTRVFSDGKSEQPLEVWQSASRFVWEDKGEIMDGTLGSFRGAVVSPQDGSLYFAKRDRDSWNLYRSRRGNLIGEFTEPEPIFELNSERNDREPAFTPDGRTLVFASDRFGDYDLFVCNWNGETFSQPKRIDRTCTDEDERQPYFSHLGELYYFCVDGSSGSYAPQAIDMFLPESLPVPGESIWPDRFEVRSASTDSQGRVFLLSARVSDKDDFDLYRVVRHAGQYGEPKLIAALCGEEDELDPRFSPNGNLLFSRRSPLGGGLDYSIHRAALHELDVRSVESAFWTMLSRVLMAIVALLIAGYLALRWKQLHPFLKFLLLSILIHLLLMLYVDPLGNSDVGTGDDAPSGFAVTYLQQRHDKAEFENAAGGAMSRLVAQKSSPSQRPVTEVREEEVNWDAQEFASAPRETLQGEEAPETASVQRQSESPQLEKTQLPSQNLASGGAARPVSLEMGALPLNASAVSTSQVKTVASKADPHRPKSTRILEKGRPKSFVQAPKSPVSSRLEIAALVEGKARREREIKMTKLESTATSKDSRPVTKHREVLASVERLKPGKIGLHNKVSVVEKPMAYVSRRRSRSTELRPAAVIGRRSRFVAKAEIGSTEQRKRRQASLRSTDIAKTDRAKLDRRLVSQHLETLMAPKVSVKAINPHPVLPVTANLSARKPRRGLLTDDLIAPRSFLALRESLSLAEKTPSLPSALASRRGSAKTLALKLGGGNEETEAAVLAGLRYLASRQNRSGAWGNRRLDRKYGDRRLGKTGLALLAFLGSGYNHQDESEFRDEVNLAIQFLLSQQDEETGHFGDCSSYGHGIATYALAEAFAMTKDQGMRQAVLRGTRRIIRAQYDGSRDRLVGGWGYYYRNPERRYDRWPRMSVTVWQIMALKSARIGGLHVPKRVLDNAKKFVLASRDGDLNALRYNHDPSWLASAYPTLPGSNAAGLFAMQLFDVSPNHRAYRTALRYVKKRPPTFAWRKASSNAFVNRGEGNLYFHYYAALALHKRGGQDWDEWNRSLKPTLLDNQREDGSWRPISQYLSYAGESNGDRSYTTALSVLMLEVYYRYFTPLTEQHQSNQAGEGIVIELGGGVEVAGVRRGSSSDRSGLRQGDVIVRIKETSIDDIGSLRMSIRSWPRKSSGEVVVLRGGKQLSLTFETRPGGFQVLRD